MAKATTTTSKGSSESGASQSKLSLSVRFKAYLKDHRRVVGESLKRLLSQPLSSAMTWMVIGIALALPVGFYVSLGNIQALGHRWEGTAQISLFLHQRVSEQAIERLSDELRSWPEVDEIHIISRDDALKEFQTLSGFADVLSHLDHNPLPVVIELLPTAEHSDSESAQLLLNRLQKLPPIELAQLDLEWVQRLAAMLRLGQRMALGLVILLSTGVLLVIGNTIRLEIENRRDEIIVAKLVGATDAFVRRPFLYTGILYGLGGGLVASIVVACGLALMNKPVATLAGLYQSNFQLLGLSFADTFSLWMMSAFLGFFGAWFSVSRHLDDLEPT